MDNQKIISQFEWPLGTRVRKTKGSSWQGTVVGFYSTGYTSEGYCVESEREPGSVQIYPRGALELAPPVLDVDVTQAYIDALTPSMETKRAYMSEIEIAVGNGYGRTIDVTVPWTSIKEIMEMIRGYAEQKIKNGR